ncbi:unnamed protein product [Phaeothamnion confervicola]
MPTSALLCITQLLEAVYHVLVGRTELHDECLAHAVQSFHAAYGPPVGPRSGAAEAATAASGSGSQQLAVLENDETSAHGLLASTLLGFQFIGAFRRGLVRDPRPVAAVFHPERELACAAAAISGSGRSRGAAASGAAGGEVSGNSGCGSSGDGDGYGDGGSVGGGSWSGGGGSSGTTADLAGAYFAKAPWFAHSDPSKEGASAAGVVAATAAPGVSHVLPSLAEPCSALRVSRAINFLVHRYMPVAINPAPRGASDDDGAAAAAHYADSGVGDGEGVIGDGGGSIGNGGSNGGGNSSGGRRVSCQGGSECDGRCNPRPSDSRTAAAGTTAATVAGAGGSSQYSQAAASSAEGASRSSLEQAALLSEWCLERSVRQAEDGGLMMVMKALALRNCVMICLPFSPALGRQLATGWSAVMPLMRYCPGLLAFFPIVPLQATLVVAGGGGVVDPRAYNMMRQAWEVCQRNCGNTLMPSVPFGTPYSRRMAEHAVGGGRVYDGLALRWNRWLPVSVAESGAEVGVLLPPPAGPAGPPPLGAMSLLPGAAAASPRARATPLPPVGANAPRKGVFSPAKAEGRYASPKPVGAFLPFGDEPESPPGAGALPRRDAAALSSSSAWLPFQPLEENAAGCAAAPTAGEGATSGVAAVGPGGGVGLEPEEAWERAAETSQLAATAAAASAAAAAAAAATDGTPLRHAPLELRSASSVTGSPSFDILDMLADDSDNEFDLPPASPPASPPAGPRGAAAETAPEKSPSELPPQQPPPPQQATAAVRLLGLLSREAERGGAPRGRVQSMQ